MRPKHCLFDVGRNMNYRIAKVKRNPSSDNHSVKLGNLENNLSIDSESFYHLFLEKNYFLKSRSNITHTKSITCLNAT